MINGWLIVFRLILAAVLSGLIGFEREFHGRAAGFRTHILLCIGSCLIMLTSMHIFDIYYGRVSVDPARIAAGVITGIGFLGAGTIMHSHSSVRGLTTAASLWVVAGLGLAVGSGLYFGSIITTVLTVVVLMMFSKIEHAMIRKYWYRTVVVEASDSIEQLKAIREKIIEGRAEITDFEVDRAKTGGMILKLGLRLFSPKYSDQLIADIGRLDGVKHAKWEVQ
ncbi:MAG: MgtC/SapB family protein [Candidatus Omnitrophica bacterium]|nr:MgtC/SapB family protein [Candidatus Omnitrophota bacterium]